MKTVILTIMLSITTVLSAGAYGIEHHHRHHHIPPPPTVHYWHHGHHRMIIPIPVIITTAPLPPPSVKRVWIPGRWICETDVYGRTVHRWIQGHWEYR